MNYVVGKTLNTGCRGESVGARAFDIEIILKISFIPETPLISIILTSGRLVTVKLKLAVSADANKYAFGAGGTLRRSHLVIGMKAQSEQRFVADKFLVIEEQACSDK